MGDTIDFKAAKQQADRQAEEEVAGLQDEMCELHRIGPNVSILLCPGCGNLLHMGLMEFPDREERVSICMACFSLYEDDDEDEDNAG